MLRQALSVRWRSQAHLLTRNQNGEHRICWGRTIRSPQVHVLLSLAATCQPCLVSLKTGRKDYIGSYTGFGIFEKFRFMKVLFGEQGTVSSTISLSP